MSQRDFGEQVYIIKKPYSYSIRVGVKEWKNQNQFYLWTFKSLSRNKKPVPTEHGIILPVEKFHEFFSSIKTLSNKFNEKGLVSKIVIKSGKQLFIGSTGGKNRPKVYMRVYSRKGDSSGFKPTKRGLEFNLSEYSELLKSLEKLDELISLIRGNNKIETSKVCPHCNCVFTESEYLEHQKRIRDIKDPQSNFEKNPYKNKGIKLDDLSPRVRRKLGKHLDIDDWSSFIRDRKNK